MEEAFGKYTLIDRLGGGGMAEVFKARLRGPAGFEKHLALKLILPHFSDDPEFVRMFIHEATLAAKLDHANIVRIHEFDQIDERYYIAMELVDGKDLRAVLRRSREADRALTVGEAVLIGIQICRALAFAHGELVAQAPVVIHRDISPHNVVLSRAGEVKITDFGIAKLASAASLTRTGTIKGKLAYMSPEQAGGAVVDARSDLFSAGCVLWEMLTGQRLFAGPNELATLDNLRSAPIPPPSERNPRVGPELDALVLAALEREPARRIGSASELLRGLEAVLSGLRDVDRSTGLASLFQELFGSQPTRRSTAVMAPDELEAGGAPEAARASEAEPETVAERPAVDGIEPIGPEPPTQVDERLVAVEPAEPPLAAPGDRRPVMRWWMGGFFLIPLAAAFVIFALVNWSSQCQPVQPEVQPEVPSDPPPEADSPAKPVDSSPSPEVSATSEPSSQPSQPEVPSNPQARADSPAKPVDSSPSPEVSATSPATSPARFGRLSLNAIPWAKVYSGKKLLGTTPLERVRLAGGSHLLILVNDDLKVRRKLKVRIRPGKLTTQVVDLRLPAP